MDYRLTKKEVLTIPNMLSFYRLVCIPVFAVLYLTDHWLASIIVLGSAMSTDLFDGFLARKLNQVTQLGVMLDPIADKMTQGIIAICLLVRYPMVWILLVEIILKEGFMLAAELYSTFKYNKMPKRSEWYGKVCCVVTDATIVSMLLFRNMTDHTRLMIIIGCSVFMVLTVILYARYFILLWREQKKNMKK